MPKRVCSISTCPNACLPGRSQCQLHYRSHERDRSARRRQQASDKQGRSVYNTKIYLRRREHMFSVDPFCAWIENGERCARIACELDHIVPLVQNGDPYSEANLQGLCREHHHQKTASENHTRATAYSASA
jgi:5-methylcytosine-specific restriction endonuclease McrA